MGCRSPIAAWLASCALACAAITPPPAQAATDDCIQCRHVDCIKGLVKQKTAMAAGYDALAKKWDPLVKVEGQPSATVDFNTITDVGDRTEFYRGMLDKFRAFAQQENDLASQVGPAAGCGAFTTEASTDTFLTCKVDPVSLARSREQAPCRQIGDLMARHEALHRDRCVARKRVPGNHMWKPEGFPLFVPGVMQTPAAHAREEAEAYRVEIAALKALLTKAEAKCEVSFTGVTTSCRIPSPAGTTEMGQDIEGKVCGNPTTASWTIHTVSWVRAPYIGLRRNIDKPWQNDCVPKGSTIERGRARLFSRGPGAGWMCVYDDSTTPPTIIIRNFRLKPCSPGGEQTFERPAIRRECGDEPTNPPPQDDGDVPVSQVAPSRWRGPPVSRRAPAPELAATPGPAPATTTSSESRPAHRGPSPVA